MIDSNVESRIELTPGTLEHLNGIAKWTSFLSIMGFIYMGFMVLLGMFVGVAMNFAPPDKQLPFPSIFISLLYVVIAITYFFPILYLFRFSRHARNLDLYKS